jgi:hypothetical protein
MLAVSDLSPRVSTAGRTCGGIVEYHAIIPPFRVIRPHSSELHSIAVTTLSVVHTASPYTFLWNILMLPIDIETARSTFIDQIMIWRHSVGLSTLNGTDRVTYTWDIP